MKRQVECLCGETAFKTVGKRDDRTIIECGECGLLRTFERPENYMNLYTQGLKYHAGREGHTPYKDRFWHDYAVGLQRIGKFLVLLGPDKWINKEPVILDVGSANGGFLHACTDVGFTGYGLEINSEMAEWSKHQTGCTIYKSWRNVDGLYDIITYHDVIEHVVDPVFELKRAREHLAPDGVIVLDTPDFEAEGYEEEGLDWHHVKPREHLWFFNYNSLVVDVIMKAGLRPVQKTTPIPGKMVVYCERDF